VSFYEPAAQAAGSFHLQKARIHLATCGYQTVLDHAMKQYQRDKFFQELDEAFGHLQANPGIPP
jgi:hypothetical protein